LIPRFTNKGISKIGYKKKKASKKYYKMEKHQLIKDNLFIEKNKYVFRVHKR
jgi:hypothetical protein